MSKMNEIEQQLEDTKAAVARLEEAIAVRPESPSLQVNLQTLLKRKRDLEQQLRKQQETALQQTVATEIRSRPNK